MQIQPTRLLTIFNPVAGRRRHARFEQALWHLRQSGFDLTVRPTHARGHAEQIASCARNEGFEMVLAAGGDGTVNEVINGLRNSPLPLAVYPLGTTNVLAAEIGMSSDPADFAHTLACRIIKPAWPAEIGDRRFALMAGIGFDAQVVNAVDERLKHFWGKGAYIVAACQRLVHHRHRRYTLTIDGIIHEAAAAVIAKGRYYGGRMVVAPKARITDPWLSVCLLAGGRRQDIIRYAVALACGTLPRQPDITIIRAREVIVDGPAGDPIQIDGDIRAHVPSIVRICSTPIMLVMR